MLPENDRSPIICQKIAAIEGAEGARFLEELLRHLGISDTAEVRDFGGVSELRDFLDALVISPGFAGVHSLAILRDAEKSASSAFASVCDSLHAVSLKAPGCPGSYASGTPRVGVFVFPDCSSPGMLETLCFSSVQDDPATSCVIQYFDCVEKTGRPRPTNIDKAYVHAYLASRPRPHLSLVQATRAGYWPWDAPAFDRLKQFLRAL